MGNKQHSWSGQLAKDASSTSRSDYEWITPKTFGCRSLNHGSLKPQQDPRWLDSNQTELWETNLSLTPESTWTEHWIRSRHFSVLNSQWREKEGRIGLKSEGLNPEFIIMRIIQTQAGWTVTCSVAMEKVNIGQRTIFNRLIKSIYLNYLVNNILIQKSMYTPHCCPPPTSPCFSSIQIEESVDRQLNTEWEAACWCSATEKLKRHWPENVTSQYFPV